MNLVFFLEEKSAKEMLKGIIPRIIPSDIKPKYITFEGKQDLEKQITDRLKNYNEPDTKFILIRDQDHGDCIQVKENLRKLCDASGKKGILIRIACRELESFYLGDLDAIDKAFDLKNKLIVQKNKSKFRNPDKLTNAKQELKKLVPEYQQIEGSRRISQHLSIELDRNRSTSFNCLLRGIQSLMA